MEVIHIRLREKLNPDINGLANALIFDYMTIRFIMLTEEICLKKICIRTQLIITAITTSIIKD